ncbi:hypothetical protein FOA52_014628 [Chlamydomonas sp. UWO 241]|nr:hypothetical protein FOA52_014628 [Chlamydomonas sp. UWO 241]
MRAPSRRPTRWGSDGQTDERKGDPAEVALNVSSEAHWAPGGLLPPRHPHLRSMWSRSPQHQRRFDHLRRGQRVRNPGVEVPREAVIHGCACTKGQEG